MQLFCRLATNLALNLRCHIILSAYISTINPKMTFLWPVEQFATPQFKFVPTSERFMTFRVLYICLEGVSTSWSPRHGVSLARLCLSKTLVQVSLLDVIGKMLHGDLCVVARIIPFW